MTDAVYPVPDAWAAQALINADRYADMYRESVEDPETFWRREAQRISLNAGTNEEWISG